MLGAPGRHRPPGRAAAGQPQAGPAGRLARGRAARLRQARGQPPHRRARRAPRVGPRPPGRRDPAARSRSPTCCTWGSGRATRCWSRPPLPVRRSTGGDAAARVSRAMVTVAAPRAAPDRRTRPALVVGDACAWSTRCRPARTRRAGRRRAPGSTAGRPCRYPSGAWHGDWNPGQLRGAPRGRAGLGLGALRGWRARRFRRPAPARCSRRIGAGVEPAAAAGRWSPTPRPCSRRSVSPPPMRSSWRCSTCGVLARVTRETTRPRPVLRWVVSRSGCCRSSPGSRSSRRVDAGRLGHH